MPSEIAQRAWSAFPRTAEMGDGAPPPKGMAEWAQAATCCAPSVPILLLFRSLLRLFPIALTLRRHNRTTQWPRPSVCFESGGKSAKGGERKIAVFCWGPQTTRPERGPPCRLSRLFSLCQRSSATAAAAREAHGPPLRTLPRVRSKMADKGRAGEEGAETEKATLSIADHCDIGTALFFPRAQSPPLPLGTGRKAVRM